jgi:hypothetical protein
LADSFDANASDTVGSIAVEPDGKILAGGFFNQPLVAASQRRTLAG